MRLNLAPTAADELAALRTLADEADTFLVLSDNDEHILREHGPAMRRMYQLVIAAKAYRKAIGQ